MTQSDQTTVLAVGRILGSLDPSGQWVSIGTCFQVAPGLLVTALHVMTSVSASDNAVLMVEQLRNSAAGRFDIVVIGTDPDHDLALLKCASDFPESIDVWAKDIQTSTDLATFGAPTNDEDERVQSQIASATWAGDVTHPGGQLFGQIQCNEANLGMSGGPVVRKFDGALAGVILERYSSERTAQDMQLLALPIDIAALVENASLDVHAARVGDGWKMRRRIEARCADLLILIDMGPVPLNVLLPWFAGQYPWSPGMALDALTVLVEEDLAAFVHDDSALLLAEPFRQWAAKIAGADGLRSANAAFASYLLHTHVDDCLNASNRDATRRVLTDSEIYTLDHLAFHMENGSHPDMVDVLVRPSWITARIRASGGSQGIEADLARCMDIRAASIRRVLCRASNLLDTMDLASEVAPDLALESTLDGRFMAESVQRSTGDPRQTRPVTFNTEQTGLIFAVSPGDAAPVQLQRILDLPDGSPTCAAISTDGTILVVGDDNGNIRSWNVVDWTLRFAHQVEPLAPITCCSVNRDASVVVVGCKNGWLHVVREGRSPESHHLHRESITGCLMHPESDWILTTSLDGHTSQWDREVHHETPLQLRELLTSYAMPSDASWVAGSTRDGTVRVWDPALKKEITSWPADSRGVVLSTLGRDRTHLLTLGRSTRMWELTPDGVGMTRRGSYDTGWASTCCMSSNGEWIATGRPDGTLTILATKGEPPVKIVEQPHNVITACVAATDDPWFVTTGEEYDVAIWDFPGGLAASYIHTENPEIISCAPTAEPEVTIAGCPDGAVMLVGSSGNDPIEQYPGVHRWPVRLCTIDSRDSTVITGDESGVFLRWRLGPPDPAGFRLSYGRIDISPSLPPGTDAMAYLPRSGSVLASLGGVVTLYRSFGDTESVKAGDPTVTALATAPSEQLAVAGDVEGTVHFIDLARRESPHSLLAHRGEVTACAISDNGQILTAGRDRMLRLWISDRRGDIPTCRAAIRTAHVVEHCHWAAGSRTIVLAAGRAGLYSLRYMPAVPNSERSEQG